MRAIVLVSASALMFAMVFTPVTHNSVKFVLLGVVLVGILIAQCARGGRLLLHPNVFTWFMYYVAVGSFFVFWGYVQDAPGTLYVGGTYVAFPALYLLLTEGANDLAVLRRLLTWAVIGGIATCAYMLDYALWTIHLVPGSLYFRLDAVQNISVGAGWVQMRLYSISGLVFLVPYLAANLIVFPPDSPALPLRRRWLWVALLLGCAGALLSGRKALMIIVVMSPLLVLVLRRFLPRETREQSAVSYRRFLIATGVIVGAAVISLPMTGLFDWDRVIGMITSGFNFHTDSGASVRLQQGTALIVNWASHPLLGAGWGQGVQDIVRSDRPWEYELQYPLLLFSTGIVGTVLYALGVMWIYLSGIRIISEGSEYSLHMVPLLVGMTSILLAHASNPYLVSGGNMWMIFFPVAMINSRLIHGPVPAAAQVIPARAGARLDAPRDAPRTARA